jgi:hypothetical protein
MTTHKHGEGVDEEEWEVVPHGHHRILHYRGEEVVVVEEEEEEGPMIYRGKEEDMIVIYYCRVVEIALDIVVEVQGQQRHNLLASANLLASSRIYFSHSLNQRSLFH